MLSHLHGKSSVSDAPGSMAGWGKTYDTMVNVLMFGQERKLRQATLELVSLRPGDHILEVGCGTGSLTLAAKIKAGSQSQVVGIDVAPDMLETARQKARKAGLSVDFLPGRIEAIPFPDNQFDLVLSSLMMHHVPGDNAKRKGIAEMLRVLKPGGQLLIVDYEAPLNAHMRGLVSHILGHAMTDQSARAFAPLLKQAGFVEVEAGPTRSRMLTYLKGKK